MFLNCFFNLSGQKQDVRHNKTLYRGTVHCWKTVVTEEGFQSLYSGLSPALLRQAVYGTIKYGLYYTIKDLLGGEESLFKNVNIAIISGGVSAAMANPTDLLKVRMQSRSAPVISPRRPGLKPTMINCYTDIYNREGLSGLFRGVGPTAGRAALVAGAQLPGYDWTKSVLTNYNILPGDSIYNHLFSSFCAGLLACTVSSPVDVIRTRLMDQRRLIRKKGGKIPVIYKSSWECFVVALRLEGFTSLYKGFVPSFTRMGPWNIIFFTVYEHLKTLKYDDEAD